MTEYKIYPPIGVARVGNAPKKFYVGPETYRGLPTRLDGSPIDDSDLRDEQQRMCRQAARFRIFRQGPAGAEEVTLATAGVTSIEWTVHVANKKASWYEFQTNLGEYGYAPNHPLRNPSVSDRQSLMIDAGPRSIAGASQEGVHFDAATAPKGYKGVNFPAGKLAPTGQAIETLGELRTDAAGRLLMLGGLGVSGSTDPKAVIGNYANNDNWWDDTSDGPVFAVVHLADGSKVDVAPAWVVVTPPAYAPEIANLVTLWDTVFDAAVKRGAFPAIFHEGRWNSGSSGYRPSFASEIGPLLERATYYPWVTAIPPKPHGFDMGKLGKVPRHGVDEFRSLREWILDVLRPPGGENAIVGSTGRTMMPYLAGDNCLKTDTLTSSYMRLTDTQYFFLQQWAAGWFEDAAAHVDEPTRITRGVLDNCVGGPFSPGIEMTWIARNPNIYQAGDPFRLNAKPVTHGPLSAGFTPQAMEPGDVCRYMAVPWQADFNECSSQPLDGRVLWWWPAQRPEFVYLAPDKKRELLALSPPPAPNVRTGEQVAWIGTGFDQLRGDFIMFEEDVSMVKYWSGLGFVMERDIEGKRKFVEVARALPRPFFPGESE